MGPLTQRWLETKGYILTPLAGVRDLALSLYSTFVCSLTSPLWFFSRLLFCSDDVTTLPIFEVRTGLLYSGSFKFAGSFGGCLLSSHLPRSIHFARAAACTPLRQQLAPMPRGQRSVKLHIGSSRWELCIAVADAECRDEGRRKAPRRTDVATVGCRVYAIATCAAACVRDCAHARVRRCVLLLHRVA